MENEKIKLLIVNSDLAGVGHFRSIWPAQEMIKKFGNDLHVKINMNPSLEEMKTYDIIHFHRQLGPFEKTDFIMGELKKAGVTLIVDIDDYWSPPTTHPLYHLVKQENLGEKITNVLKQADYVTTTTDLFAKEIKKYNKNVIVIPNAIDVNHKMWQPSEEIDKGDKLRVSWIGGSSHLKDLELLDSSISKLNNDKSVEGKYQFVLCGFDTRGHITEVNQSTGEKRTRKILPHETVWNKFESIFTSNGKILDSDYENWLKSYKNEEYTTSSKDLNYVRRWTLPLTQYGKHYNYCDVCLAPLAKNTFNEVKSELKIIEAGMTKKVLIAQDYGIYKELIKHGETGFLVNETRNHKDWYKHIKNLIENKDEVERISNNLYEFVKDRYSLETVTKNRVEIYKNIFKEKVSKRLTETV